MQTFDRGRARYRVLAILALVLGGAGMPCRAHEPSKAAAAVRLPPLVRSAGQYRPASAPITLTRADGRRTLLEEELAFDGPVLLNFVFTTCSTVCPIASRTLAEVPARLGRGEHVRMMSISLDPLNDTPEALRAYAAKFGAGPEWRFYTGSVDASAAAQRAFDLFRGDKMNHAAVTLVRPAGSRNWIRLEGFPSADQLVAELRGK